VLRTSAVIDPPARDKKNRQGHQLSTEKQNEMLAKGSASTAGSQDICPITAPRCIMLLLKRRVSLPVSALMLYTYRPR
jgi:hypothetical protein